MVKCSHNLKLRIGFYYRTSPRTKSIELQCLDTGNSFKLKQSDDIYDMPDLFKTCAQVVDVYLLGTAPIEPGSEWCWQSIKYVKDSFAIRSDDNFKVQAEIAVFMKNRIYLSSLKIVEILNKSRIHVRSFDLKEHLIAERFARHATEGLCLMTGMAEAFGKMDGLFMVGSLVLITYPYIRRLGREGEEEFGVIHVENCRSPSSYFTKGPRSHST